MKSQMSDRERSGSVVECLTRDPRVRASLRCGPLERHIYPSSVLVQPRKTRPYIPERLLMGRKESNQTNKHNQMTDLLSSTEPFLAQTGMTNNEILCKPYIKNCDTG